MLHCAASCHWGMFMWNVAHSIQLRCLHHVNTTTMSASCHWGLFMWNVAHSIRPANTHFPETHFETTQTFCTRRFRTVFRLIPDWTSQTFDVRWVLQHCTGFARLVWGRLRVHRAFFSINPRHAPSMWDGTCQTCDLLRSVVWDVACHIGQAYIRCHIGPYTLHLPQCLIDVSDVRSKKKWKKKRNLTRTHDPSRPTWDVPEMSLRSHVSHVTSQTNSNNSRQEKVSRNKD